MLLKQPLVQVSWKNIPRELCEIPPIQVDRRRRRRCLWVGNGGSFRSVFKSVEVVCPCRSLNDVCNIKRQSAAECGNLGLRIRRSKGRL